MESGGINRQGGLPLREGNRILGVAGPGEAWEQQTAVTEQELLEAAEEAADQLDLSDAGAVMAQEDPMEEELRRFFTLLQDSNRKIQEHCEKLEPIKVKPKAVPSALGLAVNSASGKLKAAELKVVRVVQEYHPRAQTGTVISQIPGPGAVVDAKKGVTLVISKGPPPDKEKHDTLRKKEPVAVLRLKNRLEKDEKECGTPGSEPLPISTD